MDALDRLEIQKTVQAVLFGNNKKRKLAEMDFDPLDENSKKRLKLREERINQIRAQNPDLINEEDLDLTFLQRRIQL